MMDEDLNERIAIEVMGWHFDEDWGCLIPPEQKAKPSEMWTELKEDPEELDDWGLPIAYREPIKGTTVSGVVYNGGLSKIRLPDYSGDMGEAWKVVEKVVDDWGCNFAVEKTGPLYRFPPSDDPSYHASVSGGNLAYDNFRLVEAVISSSPAEVVCRAALSVLERQVNDGDAS